MSRKRNDSRREPHEAAPEHAARPLTAGARDLLRGRGEMLTLRPLALLPLVVFFAVPRLEAQAASYTVTGTGCTTGRLSLQIGPVPLSVQGVPRLGSTMTLVTEGTASYPWGSRRAVWLLTGFSNQFLGPVPLPLDISVFGLGRPFCGLLQTSGELTAFVPVQTDYTVPARIPIAIPNIAALAGLRFYQQVVSIESRTFGPPFTSMALSPVGNAVVGY